MQTEDDPVQPMSASNEPEPASSAKSKSTDKRKPAPLAKNLPAETMGPGDPRAKRRRYRHKDLPLFNREQVAATLRSYDRGPFLDLLAVWMECAPDPEAIMDFADAHPDRWANALASIGKLAGFTEKKEIDIDINLNIKSLSDSQLEDRLAELKKSLIIEAEATDVTPDVTETDPTSG